MSKDKRKRSIAELMAIKRYYAEKAAIKKTDADANAPDSVEEERERETKKQSRCPFPDKFPFWARLKISKNRTTLVIDEDKVRDKQKNRVVDAFVHREATSVKHKDYEEIMPNPDRDNPDPMYLKRPRKLPKRLFSSHNKDLDMPEYLKARYDKNNHKDEDSDK